MIGGLRKGLALLAVFNGANTVMTQTEAAQRTGTTPAAARRCLLTLCHLGYLKTDGKRYWMDHGVLHLAYSYVSSTRMPRLMQPELDALSERTRESASVAVLHRGEVLVAARSTAQRSLTVGLGVGSRLPLHCSATGRVLLAAMPPPECDALMETLAITRLTPQTVTSRQQLREIVRECRTTGHALSNEEIEIGVRSLAVPLLNASGNTVAALSISSRVNRLTAGEMVDKFLPILARTQVRVRSRLGKGPACP